MGTKLVTAPTLFPVDLSAVKTACRLVPPGSEPAAYIAEDDFLTLIRDAAISVAESFLRRALLTQTWDLFVDFFPRMAEGYWASHPEVSLERLLISGGAVPIVLPYPLTQSVTWVKYFDAGGVLQTLDPSTFELDNASFPARIRPLPGNVWPFSEVRKANAVNIRFVAGWPDVASVPGAIKLGILHLCAHWYTNRESVVMSPGMTAGEVPDTAKKLFWQYRNLTVQ